MAFGPVAAAQTAVSAIPLFFGENNIFSGKGRQASRQLENTFKASQSLGLPNEYNKYLQNKQFMANTGLSSSAIGLYNRQAQRGQAAGLKQLGMGSRGSLLAGVGSIVGQGEDSALKLAQMDDATRRQNMQAADQAMLTVGGLKRQEQLRKLDEAANYWGTRKAESNASITSSLKGVASAIGSSVSSPYGGNEEKGFNLKGLFKKAVG
jgi:hypothetical protein